MNASFLSNSGRELAHCTAVTTVSVRLAPDTVLPWGTVQVPGVAVDREATTHLLYSESEVAAAAPSKLTLSSNRSSGPKFEPRV